MNKGKIPSYTEFINEGSKNDQYTHVGLYIEVDDWSECYVNDIEGSEKNRPPLSDKTSWQVEIDLNTGEIDGWKKGVEVDTSFTVGSDGEYWLTNVATKEIDKYSGVGVPKLLNMSGGSFSDQLIFEIDKNGKIKNWHNSGNIQKIISEFKKRK